MRLLFIITLLIFGCSAPFTYAQVFNLTDNVNNNTNIALGYNVPVPVDSLTPIDGFRTYNSLHLRHLEMAQRSEYVSQSQVGSTIQNRPIYAYTISDADNARPSGGIEGAVLINGTIHAREWQSPEVVTGFIEYLYDRQNDQHLAQYIIENLNFVVLPVLNIDGFIQTQRFPTQVTDSRQTPRDGRLRRKNMRNVDENINTASDNLNGIDLNRNNNPFWATSTRSSSNTTSLVYHGTGPASEPETQALQQAAVLAGEERLRMYIDTHSFTQIYFSHYTDNTRRNTLNDNIATIMRAANNNKYRYDPSPAGQGIGATDEYFANRYQALSYTLETEPLNSSAEYGGFGVSHDGFILPNSEVRRMVEETSRATIAGLYTVTDVPFLKRVEITELGTNNIVFSASYNNLENERELDITVNTPLAANTSYTIALTFNKPMRNIENNQATSFVNLSSVDDTLVNLRGIIDEQEIVYQANSETGEWQVESGFSRYKTDTYITQINLPDDFVYAAHSKLSIGILTPDMTGSRLDLNPATIVDWDSGSFTNYEDKQGRLDGDLVGEMLAIRLIDDNSPLFEPATQPPTPSPTPAPLPNQPSSSGGSLNIVCLLFAALLLRLRSRYVNKKSFTYF